MMEDKKGIVAHGIHGLSIYPADEETQRRLHQENPSGYVLTPTPIADELRKEVHEELQEIFDAYWTLKKFNPSVSFQEFYATYEQVHQLKYDYSHSVKFIDPKPREEHL